MGQALYRKYRSKSLSEIVGQEHITDTLKRAIKSDRVSHAYLFTGPRGVGKTSIARILAHELNGVPYVGEDSHLDIIEIDAASSGGVDEVRDLRDKVYIAPASGKYKVYIIDEVHMMTTSAFNALLKTLEEPPAHAVFILATTEAHKLPATIISRTQRFTFKPIARAKAVKHLRHIADAEEIDITDDALELLAEHGGGSFRDSIQMLDQASSLHRHIDRPMVERLLGIPSAATVNEIIEALSQKNTRTLITLLTTLKSSGYQAALIAKLLGETLRTSLVEQKSPFAMETILKLLTQLIEIPTSHNPDQLLELILLEAVLSGTNEGQTVPRPAVQVVNTPPVVIAQAEIKVAPRTTSQEVEPTDAVQAVESESADTPIDIAQWQAVLEALKKRYNTLYGIMRMAQPKFAPGKIDLSFGFAFHQKRANDAKNKKLLVAVLQDVTGQHVTIDCHYDKNVTPPSPVAAAQAEAAPKPSGSDPALDTISNIFGGGELLES